jgi:hypothetical protein
VLKCQGQKSLEAVPLTNISSNPLQQDAQAKEGMNQVQLRIGTKLRNSENSILVNFIG